MLKKIGMGIGGLVVVVAVGAGATLAWASSAAKARLDRSWSIETPGVPVPWPLSPDEVAALKGAAGEEEPSAVDLERVALERAIARGAHLVTSRAGCQHCHGENFGGGTIGENPAMGRWSAPNITKGGEGSRTAGYTSADWVRTLRHGVGKDGTTLTMPSIDFARLSDREVSDIIAFVDSRPRVDGRYPEQAPGPLFNVLIATGEFPLSAELIDHAAPRAPLPPAEEVGDALGAHLVTACMGCHGQTLSGGPIPGAPPEWPPAKNLTPDATGLQGWTKAEFFAALREGKAKDGRTLNATSMPWPALRNMTDVEIEALYVHLQALPPRPLGGR